MHQHALRSTSSSRHVPEFHTQRVLFQRKHMPVQAHGICCPRGEARGPPLDFHLLL